jgi:hypothetical protein
MSATAGAALGALICGLAVATGVGTLGTLVGFGVVMVGVVPGLLPALVGLVPAVAGLVPAVVVGRFAGGLVVPTKGLEPGVLAKLGNGCPLPLTATGGAGRTGVKPDGVPVEPGLVGTPCEATGGDVKVGVEAVGALGDVGSDENGLRATR